MSEKKYGLENISLVELLRRSENELRRLLSHFDQDLADKFPDKTQRLNRAFSPIESGCIMRRAMKARHDFVKSALLLFFDNCPERIGLDATLLNNVGEILAQN